MTLREIQQLRDENSKLRSEIAEIKRKLEDIRDNPKQWKAGRYGGQDQYAGMPPFLRIIDGILKQ